MPRIRLISKMTRDGRTVRGVKKMKGRRGEWEKRRMGEEENGRMGEEEKRRLKDEETK